MRWGMSKFNMSICQNTEPSVIRRQCWTIYEPPHDKTNNVAVRPAKTQISLGIRPVWSESSLSARRKLGSLATHWAHSEDSDQTGRMPRLIWVFAGRTVILLVLTWGGSYLCLHHFSHLKDVIIYVSSPIFAAHNWIQNFRIILYHLLIYDTIMLKVYQTHTRIW